MPEAPASGANANGAATPAAPAAPMQQLILDGETLDQAMSRFKVGTDRGPLVGTGGVLCRSTWRVQRQSHAE